MANAQFFHHKSAWILVVGVKKLGMDGSSDILVVHFSPCVGRMWRGAQLSTRILELVP